MSGSTLCAVLARPLLALVLLANAACPAQTASPTEGSAAPCAAVGQRCQVSPGKLGSCVLVDNCGRDNCFVCQSQH